MSQFVGRVKRERTPYELIELLFHTINFEIEDEILWDSYCLTFSNEFSICCLHYFDSSSSLVIQNIPVLSVVISFESFRLWYLHLYDCCIREVTIKVPRLA